MAASFLDQVVERWDQSQLEWVSSLTLQLSRVVQEEMQNEMSDSRNGEIEVDFSLPEMRPFVPSPTRVFDVRFSVFGPEYSTRKARVEIAGFADGSLFAPHDVHQEFNIRTRTKFELLRRIKLLQLRKYDGLVVETAAMAEKLLQLRPGIPVWIVPNAPRNVFFNPDRKTPVRLAPKASSDDVRLFYPARGYPHKNHKIIPSVSQRFFQITGKQLQVVTTLRESELKFLGLDAEQSVLNVGEVSTSECARLMYACDGVLFPSLNETFSATPLESLASERILFASDRAYVKDVLGEAAIYFDPTDPMDIANKVSGFQTEEKRRSFVVSHKNRRDLIFTEKQRADAYLQIIQSFRTDA